MEAQMNRPFGTHEQEQSQHTGEVEQQHEKKSVLKKVKAKAKKIKDSIKHLGHEQEHEHGQDRDHEDDDQDENDDDEEMVDDPEVHGAPIYESTAIRSGVVPHQDIGMAPKSVVNLEHPGSRKEDRIDSSTTSEDKMRRFVDLAPREGKETAAEHYSGVPPVSGAAYHGELERTEREPGTKLGVLTGLQVDPQAPADKSNPSNYQTKVTDPTDQSGEEAGVPPLIASFGKMTIQNEAEPESFDEPAEQKRSYTGSHDQFSPEPIPTSTHFGGPESTPKHFDSGKPEEDMPRDLIDGKPHADQESSNNSSYTDKISSAASVIVGKATTAKNVAASKLGYTEEKGTPDSATTKSPNYSPTEYAHKAATAVTETLAPIYGKVARVGSTVVSKVPGIVTDKGDEGGITESSPTEGNKVKARGVTMKEYLAEKLRPGEDDKALSEVISETLHIQKAEAGETGGRKLPVGRVTESEEVAWRLGRGQENRREGSDAIIAGSESSGSTVVDKIKDAVSLWVQKGGESPTSHQGSPGEVEGSGLPTNK